MFAGERPAGCRLQVLLESQGLRSAAESDGRLDPPGHVFRRVRTLPGVVLTEALSQVFREAGVVPIRIRQTLQGVHVPELALLHVPSTTHGSRLTKRGGLPMPRADTRGRSAAGLPSRSSPPLYLGQGLCPPSRLAAASAWQSLFARAANENPREPGLWRQRQESAGEWPAKS